MAIFLSPITHVPGVSNFGGHFGAYLKYAVFDALGIVGRSEKEIVIVIDALKQGIYITPAPAIDQVFSLQGYLVDTFAAHGCDKKDIVFVTTGIGAANTTCGCINSHYYGKAKRMFEEITDWQAGTAAYATYLRSENDCLTFDHRSIAFCLSWS